MRFKGRITDLHYIHQFAHLLYSLSRCSKRFTLRTTADKIIFVLSEKTVEDDCPMAWCTVPKDPVFSEYLMEGITPQFNEIFLDFASDVIASCLSNLRTCRDVIELKIKLTKKHVPCLTFEIESKTLNSNSTVVHDIPVKLIPRKDWGDYQEPNVPSFEMSLILPELKDLRLALDRLKTVDKRICITGSNLGTLILSANSLSVKSTAKFTNLKRGDKDPDELDASALVDLDVQNTGYFGVEVGIKQVANLVPTESFKPSISIISISQHKLLHLCYQYEDINIQYIIPGRSSELI